MRQALLAGVMRFVLFGAVGFGIGWAIAAILLYTPPFQMATFFVGGAIGGAALGMTVGNWKRAAILTLGGFLGFGLGFFVCAVFVLFIPLWALIGPLVGMVGGAALGLALDPDTRGERGIAVLALAGFVGFGIGEAIAAILQPLLLGPVLWDKALYAWLGPTPMLLEDAFWQWASDGAFRGVIGGASLGAALGYLERRRLTEEPRVR